MEDGLYPTSHDMFRIYRNERVYKYTAPFILVCSSLYISLLVVYSFCSFFVCQSGAFV